MTGKRVERIGYLWAFFLASLPFLLSAWRLVKDSLLDVPEAYLICIPVVAFFWMGFQLHRYSQQRVRGPWHWPVVVLVACGLILQWSFGHGLETPFSTAFLIFWPLWAGIVMAALYGRQVIALLWAPLFYLYLAWPPLYIAIINAINPFLQHASYSILNSFAHYFSWIQPGGVGSYGVHYGSRWIVTNVTAACSGSDSLLALLAIFPVALLVFDNSFKRKALIVAVGCVLAFIGNNLRIMAVLWAIHMWGPYWGLDVIHPLLGPVIFILLLVGLFTYGGLGVGPRDRVSSPPATLGGRWQKAGLGVVGVLLLMLNALAFK